jgi:hypothetical protein
MSEYKAHPRREDKYSSKGKHFSKSKSKDKEKRRPSGGKHFCVCFKESFLRLEVDP